MKGLGVVPWATARAVPDGSGRDGYVGGKCRNDLDQGGTHPRLREVGLAIPRALADAQNGRPEPAALSSVMAWGIALSSATLSLSWTTPSPSRKYLS